jgi:hypothetical protein
VRLRKRDVEALLQPLAGDDVAALVEALTVALRVCFDEPAGTFGALVHRCGLQPDRHAAVLALDPPALWDLATELAECRTFGADGS